MWVFIGVLLVVIVVAAVGWGVVRGGRWLWGSHMCQIERRVNRVKETQKPTLDVEHLRNLNKEEREKKINDFVHNTMKTEFSCSGPENRISNYLEKSIHVS